jgi:hypothetical protein
MEYSPAGQAMHLVAALLRLVYLPVLQPMHDVLALLGLYCPFTHLMQCWLVVPVFRALEYVPGWQDLQLEEVGWCEIFPKAQAAQDESERASVE